MSERLAAHLTRERSVTGVDEDVPVKMTFLVEGLAADLAGVGAVPGVDVLVLPQRALVSERLPTNITSKWSASCVDSNVID